MILSTLDFAISLWLSNLGIDCSTAVLVVNIKYPIQLIIFRAGNHNYQLGTVLQQSSPPHRVPSFQPELQGVGSHQELRKVHRPAIVVVKDFEESAPLVLVRTLAFTMGKELLSALIYVCGSGEYNNVKFKKYRNFPKKSGTEGHRVPNVLLNAWIVSFIKHIKVKHRKNCETALTPGIPGIPGLGVGDVHFS